MEEREVLSRAEEEGEEGRTGSTKGQRIKPMSNNKLQKQKKKEGAGVVWG